MFARVRNHVISTDIATRCLIFFRKRRVFRRQTSCVSAPVSPPAIPGFPNHYGERPSLLASRYSLRIHTSHQSTFQAIGKSYCLCLCLRADNCVGGGANTERARQTIEFQFRSVEALLPVTRLNKQSFPLIRQWRRAALWRIYPASDRARAKWHLIVDGTCADPAHTTGIYFP